MTVKFFINVSPPNKISKEIYYYGADKVITLGGAFLEDTSYKTPSIEIEEYLHYYDILSTYNYVYIEELKAYYFITDKIMEENGIIRLDLELDPLNTYKGYILQCRGRAESYENSTEKDINNNTITAKESGFTKIVEFPRDFTQSSGYILLTAGPGLASS